MTKKRIIGLAALLAAAVLLTASVSLAQRGGRGGGRGGGGARVSGGYRGGAAVGPYGGGGAASRSRGSVVGPAGGSVTRGAGGGSYTTGRGTTIDYGGAGRVATGPGGATAGRGVGGVQVTTPGGREYTKVGRAGGAVGPAGNAVGGRASTGVASGPGGVAVGHSRGGAAVGPGGAVAGGSRVGAAAGVGGGVAVGGSRVGAASGPYGSLGGYTARGVAAGHSTRYVGASAIRAQGAYVRGGFAHYNCFAPAWFTAHPVAWRAAAWTAATFWAGASWASLATTCGYPPEPYVYDYGTTIVYEGDQVYYNSDPVATAEEYTQQAAAIAEDGAKAQVTEKEEWVSLGVFGMVQGDDKDANQIFQLAINKDGVIRGNFYDALSDTTLPVHGAVEKKTQRAAWTVGDRKDTVYETGAGNLTEDETTMLVHFGKDKTQQWTLIRLEKPEEEKPEGEK